MRKILLSLVLVTSLALTSCQFDDSDIWGKLDEYGESIKDHEERISDLEELCKQMNTNISALQTIIEALQNNDYVTSVIPVTKDGAVIGYTITFSKSQPVTIYHGEDGANGQDGADGKDGYTPQIGVMKDTDNIYYWTLDGEWLLDAKGNKIKAVGVDGKDGQDGANGNDGQDGSNATDGKDGENGKDGTNGKDGADGITPRLKIENDYWYVSYDNGATWEQLGKATGEDGKDGSDGADGSDGDSIFKSVIQDDECVYLTLADGVIITLPKYKESIEKTDNKIYYTTTDGKKMFPANTNPALFGAILISNTYEDGQGVLTFDDTVTSIGNGAFSGCRRLMTITLEEGVEIIGKNAFEYCNLTNIVIPDSVTSIGDDAFRLCNSLTAFYGKFASSDNRCLLIDGVVEFFAPAGLTEYSIPNSATSIGDYAFSDCNELISITIPNSITSMGEYAFSSCDSLSTITIGDSVTAIGDRAFYYCENLTSVYCKPTTPPTGTNQMFYHNASDRKIYVPRSSVSAYKSAEYWSDYAYYIEGYDF